MSLLPLLCLLAFQSVAAAQPNTQTQTHKRKFCNTTGLVGDYRYEACGDFCKAEKAVNHCRFCKCKSCAFCQARLAESAKDILEARAKTKSGKRRRAMRSTEPPPESVQHTVTVTVKNESPPATGQQPRKTRKLLGRKGRRGRADSKETHAADADADHAADTA